MKRALVFGGTGMLGRAVAAHWRRADCAVLALPRAQADVTDREQLLDWVRRYRPELIVNCAAFTQVDGCETDRETAMAVNGQAVANVVAAADLASVDLIHISTDYVFDGQGNGRPYREDDATGPASFYGESKLAGEREALAYPRALVVRTSWLFGAGGNNFVATMLRLASQNKTLRVVDDQVGCPTYTPFLARAVWDLAATEHKGLIHYCNRDAVSWHGFAREILGPGVTIEPVTTAEFPRPAPRPAYSVLDVGHFEKAVGRRVEPWVHGLAAYLDILGEDS